MKRRLIIIVAAMMLSGVLTACSEIRQWLGRPVIYHAQTTLSVGGVIQAPNPDDSDDSSAESLVQECAALAVSAEVLEAAREAGDFPETPEVSAEVIANTSLLVLTVSSEDRDLAVAMANEVAHQVVLHAPNSLTPEQQAELDTATEEMDKLRQELEDLSSQRNDIESQLAATTDPAEITDLKERRDTIDARIEGVTSAMAQAADTVVRLQQHKNSVVIVESAFLTGSE